MLIGQRLVYATVALALSVAAAAQDLSPRVDHVPIKQVKHGDAFVVRALIVSQSGKPIFEPMLYLRLSGFSGFTHVPMKADPQMKDVFEARVPAEHVSGDFAYYVEAYDEDGNGPGRVGSPQAPLAVTIVAPPVIDRPVQVQLEPKPPVQTIVVMQAPPEPPHKSHTATVLLGVFGGVFGLATGGAGVLFNIESNNFNKAVNNNNSFSAGDYKTGRIMGYATEGGIAVTALLVVGAFVTGLWPSGDKPPEASKESATPVTVVSQSPVTTTALPPAAQPAPVSPPVAKPAAQPAPTKPPPPPPKEKDPFAD
jgi:hypothetical protein